MTDTSPSDGRAAFRHPAFRSFQAARFLAITALEMQSVAVGWQVYEITRRPLSLGLVGLAQFLPGMLLFLAGGHAADRYPRRRIIALCYGAFALCAALFWAYAVAGLSRAAPMYGVLVLMGVVRAFIGPAGQAFMPSLVPQEHFPNAVAWSSSIFQTATILGPVLGGVLYGWRGPAVVYGAASLSLACALFFILSIGPRGAPAPGNAGASIPVFEGFRYIWRQRLLLGAISLDLFAVLLGGAVALLPVYAREILDVGPWGLGLLRSAPGAGAVLMAVALAHRPLRRRAGAVMLWSVAGFGVFTVVFGLSRSPALSLAALFLTGALDMVSVVVRGTLIQLATPEHMRGRVSAVNMIFIGASNELGQFESGITAHWFGTVRAVVLGGLGTLAVVAAWARMFPELRRADLRGAGTGDVPKEANVTADPSG